DAETYDRVRFCAEAVRKHPAAALLLREATERELSLFWYDGRFGVPCKARIDLMSFGGVVDLKTCVDASREGFAKSIANFDYHIQAGHYLNGAEHALDETPKFWSFIAAETEDPFAVAVYNLDRASILVGLRRIDEAMSLYKRCLDSGKWPAYPD